MWFFMAEYHITPKEFGHLTWPQIACILDKGETSSKPELSPLAIKRILADFYGPQHRFADHGSDQNGESPDYDRPSV